MFVVAGDAVEAGAGGGPTGPGRFGGGEPGDDVAHEAGEVVVGHQEAGVVGGAEEEADLVEGKIDEGPEFWGALGFGQVFPAICTDTFVGEELGPEVGAGRAEGVLGCVWG